jgi:hypothetical protein
VNRFGREVRCRPGAGTRRVLFRGGIRTSALVVAVTLGLPRGGYAQSEGSREYQIKAAFLFNFTQFVTWSAPACPDTDAPLVIGVLGEDRFGATLEDLTRGVTVNGRAVAVERHASLQEVGTCQILFVSASEAERLPAVFDGLVGRSILSVGESPGFADRRGVIGLSLVNNRLRLEINTMAAEAANLTISSKLLRLADVVRSEGP